VNAVAHFFMMLETISSVTDKPHDKSSGNFRI
jgi:hypothetical protein